MANVNSLTSNSYSSTSNLYGNRNVLTGLASGMDTETMIQNSVSGYQTKITELQQSVTKLEWKQDAFRELTDQMVSISQKYTSYTSKTNLSSNSFFDNAIVTEAQGNNASAISATGTAKSDVQINAVTQLATAARYAVDVSALKVNTTHEPTGTAIDWTQQGKAGQVKGTMTLKYGSQTIELKFDESDTDIDSADKLKAAIEKKLENVNVTVKNGTVKASELFNVSAEGGKFTLSVDRTNKNDDGSSLYISGFSGNLATTLGVSRPASTSIEDKVKNNSFTVGNFEDLVKTPNMAEYLSGKLIDISLDGTNKQVKIGDLSDTKILFRDGEKTIDEALAMLNDSSTGLADRTELQSALNTAMNRALKNDLQASIDKQFGAGKLTVSIKDGGLDFSLPEGSGSMLKVSSEAGERLGLGKNGVSNYFNTATTLGDLLTAKDLSSSRIEAIGNVSEEAKYFDENGNQVKRGTNGKYYQVDSKGEFQTKDGGLVAAEGEVYSAYTDAEGNRVGKDINGKYYRINEKGDFTYGLTINGTTIDGISKDTTLESIINKINSNAEAGVKVGYSDLTSQFVFTANETGAGGEISFDNALAKKLFTVDHSADSVTLEKFFGSNVDWDSEGKATVRLYVPGTGYVNLGELDKSATLDSLISSIETKAPKLAGMIHYDESTGAYSLLNADNTTAMDETTANRFQFRQDGKSIESSFTFGTLFSAMGSATMEAGKDAIIDATVNGKQLTLRRSSNVVNMDGMSVTLKDEFSAYGEDGKISKTDVVTFKTSSNADTIVEAVKSFVEDVNKLINDVHSAFATQPAEKNSTKHTRYEPLTEEDKKDMSESAIKAYEEKAKQGIVFGDTDLSSLYSRLCDAIQSFGSDRTDMESIGLSTTYYSGVTTISFDETKLRNALESDPDKVRTVFTKTKDGGSKTDGLMATLKTTINAYASTSIANPGILVRKAGTKLSSMSLLNNNVQKQIDNVNTQIEKWQTKLSSKIDYYTRQFTALEKLMSTMNNQSSMLSDLMGY